jgi:hypothetical protein
MVILAIAPAYTQNCQVGFRLDGVQEFFLTDIQRDIITTFAKRQVPLTLAVISSNVNVGDPIFGNYLRQATSNTQLTEIACGGYRQEDLSLLNATLQADVLRNCTTILTSYFPGLPAPKTFVPPFGNWNSDTIAAMTNRSYRVLSAQDQCPVTNTAQVIKFPSQAATSRNRGAGGLGDGITAAETMTQIRTQLAGCSYSVVMLMATEFATNSTGTPTTNQVQLQELDYLLGNVTALNCSINTLGNMTAVPFVPGLSTQPQNTTTASTATSTANVTTTVPAVTSTPTIGNNTNITNAPAGENNATQSGDYLVRVRTDGCIAVVSLFQFLQQRISGIALRLVSYTGCPTSKRNVPLAVLMDMSKRTKTEDGKRQGTNQTFDMIIAVQNDPNGDKARAVVDALRNNAFPGVREAVTVGATSPASTLARSDVLLLGLALGLLAVLLG